MGEAILKHLVGSRPDAEQWHVESAGIWARKGSAPVPPSQLIMQSRGLDISSHRSQPVSIELLCKFDVILTMERIQKEILQSDFIDSADRVYMLSEMIGIIKDINDPVGGEFEDYLGTVQELEQYLTNGLDQIYQLADYHQNKNMGK
jgi:protein-tyrosine phosphatase